LGSSLPKNKNNASPTSRFASTVHEMCHLFLSALFISLLTSHATERRGEERKVEGRKGKGCSTVSSLYWSWLRPC